MMRRIWAARMLSCVALGACQLDSRELVLQSSLLPGGEGAEGGLLVQPASVAYGPITRGFAASARFLVENTGTTTLAPPAVSLVGDGSGAFILSSNACTEALARGAFCEVAVAFLPSDPSAREARLTIAGSRRSVDIPLSGSGLEPGSLLLQAAPGSGVLFGDVPLEAAREATLQLANPTDTSSGQVELISNNAAFRLVPAEGNECASSGVQLAAGQSCNFRVRFAPELRGLTDATITARSLGTGSVSLGVSGRGLAPARLLVDAAGLDFGDVLVAGAAVLDIAIGNGGDEPLPPVTSTVSGEAASDFRVSDNGCSAPLAAGETCSISVAFSPRATGPHGAVLDLDAGSAGSVGVDLSGAGLPAGNLIVVATDGSDGDFGSVGLGSESHRTLRVGNTSNEASGPITLAVNNDEFGIEPATGSECVSGVTNLATGTSCDVRVRFAPTQRRQRNATLTVSSNVGGAALNLSGVGLAGADFRVDGPVDFGSISQGSTTMRSVIVTNAGDEPLAPLSARVSGFNATSFSVQRNDCMLGLEAQASCVIAMVFAPATTGSYIATLTLEGEPGSTLDVALSGTGLAPALLGVQPSAIFFDTPVDVGQTARAGLSVSNRGDAATGRISAIIATAAPGFSVTPGTCTAALATGESCELDVVFAPTASGLHSSSVRVTSTPGGTLEVPVSGTGNAPASLTVIATEGTDFGDVGIGASATRSFTLRNTGDLGAGTLLDIALGSGFSLAPSIGSECQPGFTPLAGAASCVFRVLFQPVTTGNAAVTLGVSTSLGASTSLFLTGAGVPPPAFTASASTIAFVRPGPVSGQSDENQQWTVRNTGGSATENLTFTNSNQREFPVFFNTCIGSLAADAECTAMFQLAPTAPGERTAVMTLSAGTLSTSVTVTGIGN